MLIAFEAFSVQILDDLACKLISSQISFEDAYKFSIAVVTIFNETAMALGKSILIDLADVSVAGIRYV